MPPRTNATLILSPWKGRIESASICRSCAHSLRRQYVSTAEAPIEDAVILGKGDSPTIAHSITTSVVLSRPPQITRDLHPFEKAYYLYQKRLNDRLALPFTRYFYFNENTDLMYDFRQKIKVRGTPARDIGHYDAYGENKWADEVVMGAQEGELEHMKEALLADEIPLKMPKKETDSFVDEPIEKEVAPPAKPNSRITEADEKNDQQSLNRMLQRTLYLVVKGADGKWQFPTSRLNIAEKESFNQSATRIIRQAAGVNMNTWVVSNHPIAHVELDHQNPQVNENGHLVKKDLVFFMKARIMAGQADLSNNELGLKEFKWLCKEEIHKLFNQTPYYWNRLDSFLPQR